MNLDKNEMNVAVGILKRDGIAQTSGNKIILSGDGSKVKYRADSLSSVSEGKQLDDYIASEFVKRGIIEISENVKEFVYATPSGLDLIRSDKFSMKLVDKLTTGLSYSVPLQYTYCYVHLIFIKVQSP